MRRHAFLLVFALLFAHALLPRAGAEVADAKRVDDALTYLKSHGTLSQNLFESLAAAGADPYGWPDATHPIATTPIAYPTHPEDRYSASVRMASAWAANGMDPTDIQGLDGVALVRGSFDGTQFGNASRLLDDAFAILALRAAGVGVDDPQIASAASWLHGHGVPTGGWSANVGSPGSVPVADVDSTGMVLSAMKAAGFDMSLLANASSVFSSAFRPDAGDPRLGEGYGACASPSACPVNLDSTAWAIHGLHALGLPAPPPAFDYVRELQREDGGFIRHGKYTSSDPFATAEAVVLLSGAHYPIALRPAVAPQLPSGAHAGDAARFSLSEGGFTQADWRFAPSGGPATGLSVGVTFQEPGPHSWSVSAWGPGVRHRANGTVDVLSWRPVARVAAPTIEGLRHEPVVVDASASSDPDGQVVALRVEWGDGNETADAPGWPAHAYERPGSYAIRVFAQDEAGGWSDPARVTAHVRNRAPILSGVATVKADRVNDVLLAPSVWDPEEDPVELSWTAPQGSGTGEARLRFATLGNATVRFVARDAFGAEAVHDVRVEILNLAPTLANVTLPSPLANETVTLEARADDADGPPPTIEWRVGPLAGTGARIDVSLPAGEHLVTVVARDADNATAMLKGTLVVRAPDAPEEPPAQAAVATPAEEDAPPVAPAPPPLEAPRFAAAPERVRVGQPADYVLSVAEGASEYLIEFGDGRSSGWIGAEPATHAWSQPGTYELRATARAPDGRTATTTLVVTVVPLEAPAPRAPSPPPAPEPPPVTLPPLEPLPQVLQEASRREAPGPAPALALLLAALGMRARRAGR